MHLDKADKIYLSTWLIATRKGIIYKLFMKEILIYLLVAIAGLSVLGYSVHMLIGGLVSKSAELYAIVIVCLLGIIVMAFMAWDIVRRRR